MRSVSRSSQNQALEASVGDTGAPLPILTRHKMFSRTTAGVSCEAVGQERGRNTVDQMLPTPEEKDMTQEGMSPDGGR